MEIINAIILGIIQGLTEFLPVSSSGHLEIAKAILGDESVGKPSMLLTVVLHFATALSTIVVFRKDLLIIIKGLALTSPQPGIFTFSSLKPLPTITKPSILEAHGGKIALSLEADFAEKYFSKQATVDFTPVLIYQNGEQAFKTITVQGEEAAGGEVTVFNSSGGSFKYQDAINYSKEMMNSTLELRAIAKQKDKEKELGPINIALGVIATSTRIQDNENLANNNHGYEHETILEETQERISIEAQAAVNDYELAVETYFTNKENLALAIRIEQKNQSKYFEGMASTLELRQAQLQLYSAQNSYISSIQNVIQKKLNLETLLNTSEL